MEALPCHTFFVWFLLLWAKHRGLSLPLHALTVVQVLQCFVDNNVSLANLFILFYYIAGSAIKTHLCLFNCQETTLLYIS